MIKYFCDRCDNQMSHEGYQVDILVTAGSGERLPGPLTSLKIGRDTKEVCEKCVLSFRDTCEFWYSAEVASNL